MKTATKTTTQKRKVRDMVRKREPYRQKAFDAFVEWSIWTTRERKESGLPTARAFAKKYKINEAQLSRWKQRKDYLVLKKESLLSRMADVTPDILNGLKERCIKYGMASDVQFWLSLVEQWDKEPKDKGSQEYFSLNDVNALIDVLPEKDQKQFDDTLVRLVVKAQETMVRGG